MQHGTDLTYEAQDLVAPLRSGLHRIDWRRHAEAIREVTAFGGNDHDMARAVGVTRKHMLAYAAEVPQFADVLHTCLDSARKGTSSSWSTTWAWKKTAGMTRVREKPESTRLPRIREEVPVQSNNAIIDGRIAELQSQAMECLGDTIIDPGGAELITGTEPDRQTVSARLPRELRAEDWEQHAIEIIRIGQSGGDDYSMAAELRISRNMLLQYARAVPDFNEALMYARTCARAWWADAMRLAISKRSGLNAKMVVAGHAWIMRTDDTGQPSDPPRSGRVRRKRKRKQYQ